MWTGGRLETATIADAAEMARMSRRLIERGLVWRWTERRISDALRDRETASVAAREEGSLLGFALMNYDFSRREAHLLLLAVAPGVRRRGLGGTLLEWLEKLARAGGILRVELEVRADDPGACAFYRRLGYREIDRLSGYYQGRVDAVRMARVRHPVVIKGDPPWS